MIKIEMSYAADDSCQIQLWARGAHEPEAFLDACEQYLFRWDGRRAVLVGKPVISTHWRTVQANAETKACGVCDTVLVPSSPGRGAYLVTSMDEWLPLHVPRPAALVSNKVLASHLYDLGTKGSSVAPIGFGEGASHAD